MAKKTTNSKEKESKKAAPKKAAPKKDVPKLIPGKKYKVEGLGKDGLEKGKVYEVSGQVAEILITKGSVKIKS